jgi:diguanylate cyclase (GGDEF)-like protein
MLFFMLGIQYGYASSEQYPRFSFSNNASQFLSRLSPNEGLSQSYVIKTVQDQQGFIWIATGMGLNRYDGYRVQQISGPNNVFATAEISTLFIDKQGYLWVSTLHSGLYRVNTHTLATKQFFSGKFTVNDPEIAEVITIAQASDNSLWLGISGRVMRLNITTGELTTFLSLKTQNQIVRDLLVSGNWLFCATSRGVYRINITTKQATLFEHRPKNITDNDSINTKFLIADKKLGLLVGTVNGLFSVKNYRDENINNMQAQQLLTSFNIWQMLPYESNYLIATNKGLYRYISATKQVEFILKFSDSRFQITDDNILNVFADRTGNLWLASKSQGVMIWSPLTQRFQNISASTHSKLSHDNVWSLAQSPATQGQQGDLWIGTDNGLNRLNLTTGKIDHYLVNDDQKAVTGEHVIRQIFINPDDGNLLWIVNDSGLYSFNKSSGKLARPYVAKKNKNILENKFFYGVSIIDNQTILFFTDKGHYRYNSVSGEIKSLAALDNITPVSLSWSFLGTMGENNDEVLLTTSGHLYRYNLNTEKVDLLYRSPNFQPQTYDYVDSWVLTNNILWIAMTGEGLIGIDSQSLQEKYRFNTTNGLSTNSIYSLQQDHLGSLWFSSQKGIYRFDLKNHHFEHYNANDGLLANEYNGFSYTKLSDDRLVFGSTRGITLLLPADFIADSKVMKTDFKVQLTALELFSDKNINQKQLIETDKILLNYDDYGLKLHFSTLQFLQQDKTLYDINLTGPAPLHLKYLAKNELLLSKLPPGQYQLTISAIHPMTAERSIPLVIAIDSLQAPWWSITAKLSYALVLFLILFSYFKVRQTQRRVLENEHEKLQASQTQMQLALNASGSGIWDYQVAEDLFFESRVVTGLTCPTVEQGYSLAEHFAQIHPEQRDIISQQWASFIQKTPEQQESAHWDVSFKMKSKSGAWLWFRETGAVIKRNEQGAALRVSGTYTNITELKSNETQMQLFGEAFRQINDWVLILDANKRPLTANKAFMGVFVHQRRGKVPTLQYIMQLIGEQKYQEFSEIIDNIKAGCSWQGEEVIATQVNKQHPVLIKINAIAVEHGVIARYVVVISDISSQKNAEEKLRHLAHYDYLTNLPNRKLILEKIDYTIKAHQNTDHKSALFFIDLDKFKQVNDSLGHHAGDELLKHVADTLVANVKARDIVARQSGDEFMILIESFKHLDDLTHLAQRINNCLAEPLKLHGSQINISSSIGIAIFPDDAINSAELIRKADLAMIYAKQAGRSQFQFFTQQMNAQAHRRLELENELMQAVKQNQLVNYYQAIVDCAEQKIVGFELLMRWPHIDGMISPIEFIPIAEEIGLINTMTEQAVDRALTDYVKLQQQFPHCYISVNLSAIHILQQGLCSTLQTLLAKHQLPATVLRLEITEGTLLVDKETALQRLQELKQQGFKLLLDDFGTGYSSLTYLSQFPIDVLKIDQSFVRHLQSNPMNKPIIQAIVSLANSLTLSCIAEGIEDLEQLDYIRALGCQQIQGYYFSKPVTIEQITASLFWQDISSKLKQISDTNTNK